MDTLLINSAGKHREQQFFYGCCSIDPLGLSIVWPPFLWGTFSLLPCVAFDSFFQELSLARDGVLDGLTWRHRATHEPASPLSHHRWPKKPTPRAPPPYGTVGECSLPAVRSGRRACKVFTADQGERLLAWKDMPGDSVAPLPLRKVRLPNVYWRLTIESHIHSCPLPHANIHTRRSRNAAAPLPRGLHISSCLAVPFSTRRHLDSLLLYAQHFMRLDEQSAPFLYFFRRSCPLRTRPTPTWT